jgi:hypothetical protein
VSTGRFTVGDLEALDSAKIVGVRSGDEHRYTGVWVVVVERRVFVRSWSDRPSGWFRAFLDEPLGSLQVGEREVRIRGRRPRGARLARLVTAAYAAKYPTRASKKWVDGFAEPAREATTLELLRR